MNYLQDALRYLWNLINDPSINKGDAGAGGIMLASIINALPTVSAVLTIIWVALRIYVSLRDEVFKKGNKSGNEQ
jgi:hypothetical protein